MRIKAKSLLVSMALLPMPGMLFALFWAMIRLGVIGRAETAAKWGNYLPAILVVHVCLLFALAVVKIGGLMYEFAKIDPSVIDRRLADQERELVQSAFDVDGQNSAGVSESSGFREGNLTFDRGDISRASSL